MEMNSVVDQNRAHTQSCFGITMTISGAIYGLMNLSLYLGVDLLNNIIPFSYNNNGIRVVMVNGEPWFIAKDVCEVLGITNYRNAVSKLSETMKDVHNVDTPGGNQEMAVVSEAGVYKIVFTSRKPEAERFTNWLASEVIPQIRKTGSYIKANSPLEMVVSMAKAIQISAEQQIAIQNRVAATEEKIEDVTKRVALVNSRLDAFDNLNLIRDPRKRLNSMIAKYAYDRGIAKKAAWHEFRSFFNTAYGTNIMGCVTRYLKSTGKRDITVPAYLEAVGKLEDAIRVADKMLNP
jgi:prophage antirepressor-like protein